jgi:thiol-disulfide isomerase/thioredoxin
MSDKDYLNYINKLMVSSNNTYNGVLLFFSATWCGPCKKIKPHVLSKTSFFSQCGINVVFIDIDTNTDQYGNNAPYYQLLKKNRLVRGIPSLLLYTRQDNSDDNDLTIKNIYPSYFCESDVKHFNALIEHISKI